MEDDRLCEARFRGAKGDFVYIGGSVRRPATKIATGHNQ
jgi:hypothetical protein